MTPAGIVWFNVARVRIKAILFVTVLFVGAASSFEICRGPYADDVHIVMPSVADVPCCCQGLG